MAGIPDHVVEEIRDRADLVEVVGRHVTLRKTGNRHWGLCPFHSEKTPSFSVQGDKQIYYCFGCNAHGDVFSFRMAHDSLDFVEAVRTLARELGITIPEGKGPESGRTEQIFAANAVALAHFRQGLRSREGAVARRYLEERQVPADLIDRFQIGFAPPGWEGLLGALRAKGVALEVAEAAGLIARRQTGDGFYDKFRNRVVFPIFDATQRVLGFGARAMGDDQPKYLNSQESPVYRKSRVLFGLPLALEGIRKRDRAIVVEGYFDAVALHRAGIMEAVAPCGTSLTAEHARLIRRYTRNVTLLFDGDDAGTSAAERSLPHLLAAGLRVMAAFLPKGEDPDTLLCSRGPAALEGVVDGAVRLLDHLIDERIGLAKAEAWEAVDVVKSLNPLLSALPDEIERTWHIQDISSRMDLQRPQIVEDSRRAQLARDRGRRSSEPAPPAETPSRPARPEISPLARELIAALASHPELAAELDPGLLDGQGDGREDDRLGTEALGSAAARELLRVVYAACTRTPAGPDVSGALATTRIAKLLSPNADELTPELKVTLSEILARAPGTEIGSARKVLEDCVSRLEDTDLERRHAEIRSRLENCNDTDQELRLLEELQQLQDVRRRKDQRLRGGSGLH